MATNSSKLAAAAACTITHCVVACGIGGSTGSRGLGLEDHAAKVPVGMTGR